MTGAQGRGDARRILVVDDDQHMLRAISGALEDEGLNVATAADGLEALTMADARRPDLVVLDVTLPVVDSRQVAARLRERIGGGIPVLVITADGHAAEKARQLGAYAYLRKPFDLSRLIEEVHRGLRVT